MMSQKTITSFFCAPKNAKVTPGKLTKSPVKLADEVSSESPVKRSTRRSIIRPIIDSDDESNEAKNEENVDNEDEKCENEESEEDITVKRKLTSSKKGKISDSEDEKLEIDEKSDEEVDSASLKHESDEEVVEKVEVKKLSSKEKKKTVEKKVKKVTKGKKRKSSDKKDSSKESKKAKTTSSLKNGKLNWSVKKEDEQENSSEIETDEIINPANYNPARSNYKPIEHACWKKGEKVPYAALSKTLEIIENTSARLKMIEILANFFRSVIILTPEDLIHCVYLCLNRLAPAYEGLELGVGDTIVIKAIAQTTGRTVEKLKAEISVKGDLGLVAESSRSNQKTMFQPAPLTVCGVFKKLKEIAQMIGNSSMTKKTEKIQSMLVACRFSEARFLVRSLGSKLRIGLAEQSLLVALAHALILTPPDGQELKPMSKDNLKKKLDESALIIKTTYCECPNYDKIIDILLKQGIDKLPEFCQITPGIPLKPMLAQPTKGIQDVFHRFEKAKFSCEFKYDGERAQIHLLENGEVHVYSRNQENNTTKYPDIVKRIPQICKENVKNCIIDAEAVAWDSEKKQILPFQVLSTRKRKDANEKEIKVKVCVFAFDLLFFNGKSLVKETFSERRRLLKENFNEEIGEFVFVEAVDSDNVDEIAEFLDTAIKGNCEGLMVKTLDVDATYEISKRSRNWLKLKKDYLDGVGDSLDLVVIGGYYGKGKRTGNYGGFLLACYDDENEEYQTICKLGTGFSDEMLESRSKILKDHVIPNPKSYYSYDTSHAPDVWFDTVQVWEVKCADISVSPVHKAALGIVDESKGLSLRFPRFVRVRDDKDAENATNATQVSELYRNQEQIKNQTEKPSTKENEDDDY